MTTFCISIDGSGTSGLVKPAHNKRLFKIINAICESMAYRVSAGRSIDKVVLKLDIKETVIGLRSLGTDPRILLG